MRRWAAIATIRTAITAANPTGAIAIAATFYAVHAIAIAISHRHHRHALATALAAPAAALAAWAAASAAAAPPAATRATSAALPQRWTRLAQGMLDLLPRVGAPYIAIGSLQIEILAD